MPDILIRDVDVLVDKRLKELAEKQGLSREEYLRRRLKEIAILEYETERIDKYAHLVEYLSDIVTHNSDVLKRAEKLIDGNSELLKKMNGRFDEDKN